VLACLLVCGAAILTDLAWPVSLGPALAGRPERLETTGVRGIMLAAFAFAALGPDRAVTRCHG